MTSEDDEEDWSLKDLWLSLLFLLAGLLVVVFTLSAMNRDLPAGLWRSGGLIGPLLILLGGVGTYRSLRSRRR